MPIYNTKNFVLNDDTMPLIKNSSRSVSNLEYVLASLMHQSIDDVGEHVSITTDKVLLDVDAALEPDNAAADSTLAYVQTLITTLSRKLMSSLLDDSAISFKTAPNSFAPQDDPTLNIKLVANPSTVNCIDTIKQDKDLFTKIRAWVVDIFINANPFNTDTLLPINYLLRELSWIDRTTDTPVKVERELTNKFLYFTAINDCREITEYMLNTVMVATLLGHLIKLTDSRFVPAIRVSGNRVNLIINDLKHPQEIALSDFDNSGTRYYSVYWQAFDDGVMVSHGTTPVRCDGMFNIANTQILIALLHDLERVLVISWQTIDNQNDYYELNA